MVTTDGRPKQPARPSAGRAPSARQGGAPPGPARRPPRPSRRTIAIRRLGALIVLTALVVVVGLVIGSLTGDPDTANGDPTGVTDPSAGTTPDPGDTSPTTQTTVDGGAVVTPRVPTAAEPLRVLLVGDSEAGGLSPFLDSVLQPLGMTAMTTDYKVSSGLVRDDFFDWPARLQEVVPANSPEIVIAMFGANDGQPFTNMPSKKVDSPEWRAEYALRVGAAMDYLGADGRTLIWVGVPNGRDSNLKATLPIQNGVVEQQVAAHPNVIFVDTWHHFSGIDGSFAPVVMDPRDGKYVDVRSEQDNFHLNTIGEKILAKYVTDVVVAQLVARGATVPADMPATATTLDSDAVGTYTIATGDSLSGIAARVGTTMAAIVAQNGWADENQLIFEGMKIEIPAKSG